MRHLPSILLLSAVCCAQDATFSTDVKLVSLLATVRDRDGKPVKNLTKDDFTLEEDGRPQTIRFLSEESNLPLLIGLLVDTSTSQSGVIKKSRHATHTFHKVYKDSPDGQKRYSPAACIGCEKKNVTGDPDPAHVSTSYVERQNLNMRMGMRRFTRLTNAFSKKVENLAATVALYYTYYNFCRVHQTLKTTPAITAGIADHVWSVEEIVSLMDSN